jgi:hypothetical protein
MVLFLYILYLFFLCLFCVPFGIKKNNGTDHGKILQKMV